MCDEPLKFNTKKRHKAQRDLRERPLYVAIYVSVPLCLCGKMPSFALNRIHGMLPKHNDTNSCLPNAKRPLVSGAEIAVAEVAKARYDILFVIQLLIQDRHDNADGRKILIQV